MEWLDGNKIQIIPPKRPKKLTGTRFATILGLNPWSTPFEIWCEVTRTYQKPFEDTIYTIAGKTIKNKSEMFVDLSDGNVKQVGYVITGKTEFDKGDYTGYSTQYIDLWVTILTVVDTVF